MPERATASHASPDTPPTAHPADRLVAAIDRAGVPACVGLDPDPGRFPSEIETSDPPVAIERFCIGVLDAVAGVVPVVKPQSAHFERWGSRGVASLERVIAHARDLGLYVVLDVKRGDIGSTARHYAASAAAIGADAVTVSPYLGPSGIEPFLDAGLLVFVLVRTSNPDSDRLQSARLEDGHSVAERVASMVAELGAARTGSGGLSSVGAVVGATKAAGDGAPLRRLMPDAPLLVPGVGAQGGSIEDVRAMCRPGDGSPGRCGVLINASRSVLYPASESPGGWDEAVGSEARAFASRVRALAR